mmetsp:Transcript_21681/g.36481  ORF Transcript_21681/g.36481 Transcript_21681/m.36481 type:complete len:105 (+) Transcript_21681:303-617(+)
MTTKPGPVNVVLNIPSPPQQQLQQPPELSTPILTDSWNPTTESVSTRSFSPASSVLVNTVPDALRNKVPAPEAFCRIKPMPPQQQLQQLQSQSTVTFTSPVEAK